MKQSHLEEAAHLNGYPPRGRSKKYIAEYESLMYMKGLYMDGQKTAIEYITSLTHRMLTFK
jgi:hypothetical protein